MIVKNTPENRHEALIHRVCSHLENLNSPEDLGKETGEWTWKEEVSYSSSAGKTTMYFLYQDGECIEAFDELSELEAFTRGMICYQTSAN